jgi:hypothetical protein
MEVQLNDISNQSFEEFFIELRNSNNMTIFKENETEKIYLNELVSDFCNLIKFIPSNNDGKFFDDWAQQNSVLLNLKEMVSNEIDKKFSFKVKEVYKALEFISDVSILITKKLKDNSSDINNILLHLFICDLYGYHSIDSKIFMNLGVQRSSKISDLFLITIWAKLGYGLIFLFDILAVYFTVLLLSNYSSKQQLQWIYCSILALLLDVFVVELFEIIWFKIILPSSIFRKTEKIIESFKNPNPVVQTVSLMSHAVLLSIQKRLFISHKVSESFQDDSTASKFILSNALLFHTTSCWPSTLELKYPTNGSFSFFSIMMIAIRLIGGFFPIHLQSLLQCCIVCVLLYFFSILFEPINHLEIPVCILMAFSTIVFSLVIQSSNKNNGNENKIFPQSNLSSSEFCCLSSENDKIAAESIFETKDDGKGDDWKNDFTLSSSGSSQDSIDKYIRGFDSSWNFSDSEIDEAEIDLEGISFD